MFKLLPILLAIAPLVATVAPSPPGAIAGTCVANSSCPPQPIRFTPGQKVSVEIVNATAGRLEIQQVGMMNPTSLQPGQKLAFLRGETTRHNFSVLFWNHYQGTLIANLSQPSSQVLRIEVRPGGQTGGHSAVYLRDDGRVEVL